MFKNIVFKPSVDTKEWFKAAIVRAVKTFAQALGGFITVGVALSDVNWKLALSVSAAATIYSVITSISGLPEVKSQEAQQ